MQKLQPTVPNVYQEKIIFLQMSLGIGYAGFIEEITTLNADDDGWDIEAKMRIWPHQVATAELKVDKLLVVRAARIDAGFSQISVSNEGRYNDGVGFVCAMSGKFERLTKGGMADKFDVSLNQIQPNLLKGDFARLADMSTPQGETLYEKKDNGYQRVTPVSWGGNANQ